MLEHVSFVAEPGQTVAIVGTTGSGKSTIINLIPRFYDVTGGRVPIDGHDVRDVTLESLRRQIGIVLQDTVLFSGTIRENIAYGAPDASLGRDRARGPSWPRRTTSSSSSPRATTRASASAASGLSGGQMQRIAIARALLLDPRILILDDSTSSVDAETEYQIQQALDELIGGPHQLRHRPAHQHGAQRRPDPACSTARGSSPSGTHEELLATSALYGEIVASQLRDDAPRPVGRGRRRPALAPTLGADGGAAMMRGPCHGAAVAEGKADRHRRRRPAAARLLAPYWRRLLVVAGR